MVHTVSLFQLAVSALLAASSVSASVVSRIECSNAAAHIGDSSSIIVCPDASAESCLVQLGPHEPAFSLQACFTSAACSNVVDTSEIPVNQVCWLYTVADEENTDRINELKVRRRRPVPIPKTKTYTPTTFQTKAPEATLGVESLNVLMGRDSVSYDASCSSMSTYTSKVCTTFTSLDYSSSCSKSVFSTATCLNGYLCKTGGCMKLENDMDTAGIIVAICFGSFIVLSIGLMCFFCCRERANDKKIAARQEAEAIAKAAAMDQKKADRQPLMGNDQPNPFQDQH